MGLQSFENGLGRMVEGMFSRAFKSSVRPIEIGRRLVKEIDSKRAVDVKGRRVVPNEFVISLSPTDHAALAEIEAALIAELVEAVKEYCADESYHLRGTVLVTIKSDENLTSGRIDIDSVVRKTQAVSGTAVLILADDRRVNVGTAPVVIGRSSDCDIAFDDSNVSRRHAEVTFLADAHTVTDLASTNGTKVNGVTITAPRTLRHGDIISVGTYTVRYEAQ
ncbi:MAG: DUF3662 and FHA domain-containing protein [Actinomycetes bacterium]